MLIGIPIGMTGNLDDCRPDLTPPLPTFGRDTSDCTVRMWSPCHPGPMATAAAHAVASQGADNDVENGNDAVDNGQDYAADAVDDGH